MTKTVIEKVQTPGELLRDCPAPSLDNIESTGDIERALGEAIVSLNVCTEDKHAIRDWQEAELE